MDMIPIANQASKVRRRRRAADLKRQHGHFVDDPLLKRAASAASGVTAWRGIVWALVERSNVRMEN